MTEAVTAMSTSADSATAGREIGEQVRTALAGAAPDALVVFASAQHDFAALLGALDATCHPGVLVGCSSAGEFTGTSEQCEGAASAVALRSADMQFTASVGRGLRADTAAAARQIVEGFRGVDAPERWHRYALVLTDALAGRADDLVEHLTRLTSGTYRFFGGGAGDDARFEQTHVFRGTEAIPDATVALEILSTKPIGIGARHGWQPASPPLRATEATGTRLVSLNAAPAVEVVEEHAGATGQVFDPATPLPFFLQNVFGVDTGAGHRLRVPLGVEADGSINCAAEIPPGATVSIMGTTAASAAQAAREATSDAVAQLGGLRPKAALFFDCVATRLRTGPGFGDELRAVQDALGPDAVFAGCNTYGQVARAEGQFSGFHNCTAVVCVLPD